MKNQEIAKILYKISNHLKMKEIDFRPFAYARAASSLEALEQDVEEIYFREGLKGLEKIPKIGKNIALKIEEYIKTGRIETWERIKKELPVDLDQLSRVEGMGPRKARILFRELKIKDLKDLERAAKAHKIAPLFGFGPKTEKNILEGIAFLKRDKGRFLLAGIMPTVSEIIERLGAFKEVGKISVAGSVRRMQETVGDVDILAVSKKPEKVMDFFVSLPEVDKIWSKGPTRSSVRVKDGFDIDLRVVPEKSYGSALQYFTGSKEHNIATRRIAMAKGLKLNEYGVFKGSKMIAGKTEEEVYKALGLPMIPPEIRSGSGETKLKTPDIIGYGDILGDLHCHSDWDGGSDSIRELARTALARGYKYIGISDHTKFLKIERGLDEKELSQQRKEIDKLNSKLKIQNPKFRLLQGCEANILNDGSIDIKDEALKKLDYVIAGVHSSMKMEKKKMTERLIKAMKNPHIDIISHPTGRLIQKRDEYQIDFDRILRTAKETKTILEINSSPIRLDLRDINIRRAKEAGVKMIINTDAHNKEQLSLIKFGIAQARRGWARKEDIINSQPLDKLLEYFKQ